MIAAERETVVTFTDADTYVHLYTCRRSDITALSKKIQPIGSGAYQDGTPWAEYHVPVDLFKLPLAIRRKRDLTDEQREALRERARAMQAARA